MAKFKPRKSKRKESLSRRIFLVCNTTFLNTRIKAVEFTQVFTFVHFVIQMYSQKKTIETLPDSVYL